VIRAASIAGVGLASALLVGVGTVDRSNPDNARPTAEIAASEPELWPICASPPSLRADDAAVERRLAAMSVREKVGQTVQAGITSIRPADLAEWPVGSILAGGDDAPNGQDKAGPEAWLALARAYQDAAPTPLLLGIDAVHGHNNVVGAVIFPHHVGLGAARDPDLVRRVEAATAEEVGATGFDWDFAPTLAVPQDPRWGRSYEGFSSDPAIVASYAGAAVRGLQGDPGDGPLLPGRVAATAKHFLGDGGTHLGRDQGDTRISEAELVRVHAAGYPPAIEAGALTVMASFSSWNGRKMHGNQRLLTDVLKGRLGFAGLVVGDWNAHEQLPGCTAGDCPDALNAGIDLLMAPYAWKELFRATLSHVETGRIPLARLDDAVRRILRVKAKLGLLDGPRERPAVSVVGSPAHRAIAREAVQKSAVLLKNDGVLPIRPGAKVLVTGPAADDIAAACGGWTLSWQGVGNTNTDFPNGQSIGAALGGEVSTDGSYREKPDVAVVVFAEPPYAESRGDLDDLDWNDPRALRILLDLRARGIPTVAVLFSGRPRGVDREIAASDAFVAAFLPGTEGGGLADLLAGRAAFQARLSRPWPGEPSFPLGYGLDAGAPAASR
jgi:beta-glucosidase